MIIVNLNVEDDMLGGVDEYDSDSDGYSNSDTGLMNEDYEL